MMRTTKEWKDSMRRTIGWFMETRPENRLPIDVPADELRNLLDDLDTLESKLAKAREALGFYADEVNITTDWDEQSGAAYYCEGQYSDVWGTKARAALGVIEEKE